MLINFKITTEYYSDLFSYIATTLKLGIIKSPIEDIKKYIRIIPSNSNSVLTTETCLFSYRKPFDALAEFGKMELSSANIPNLRTLIELIYALRTNRFFLQIQKLSPCSI